MADPFAKKSLGQHWLNDETSLEAMCAAADVQPDDLILEIGPGPGALTKLLVARVREVVAVEFDERLAAELPSRVSADNLHVMREDILKFDLTRMTAPYKVVANIPYYLTSNLVRLLSESANPPAEAVLLVQKEVADRLAAQPGAMSLLSATAQFYWQVSLGPVVPAELFTPAPKVDSQIVIMQYRAELMFSGINRQKFFRLIKMGFAQRRKTLLNSLCAGLHTSREDMIRICDQAGVDPRRRPQTLSLEEWHDLYRSVNA